MQNLYKCINYTQNENMNKTCQNNKMCKIYHDEVCEEYKEKEDENISSSFNVERGINTNSGK